MMRVMTVFGLGSAPAGSTVVVTVSAGTKTKSVRLAAADLNSVVGWDSIATLLRELFDHAEVMFNTAIVVHDGDALAGLDFKVEIRTTTGSLVSTSLRNAGGWRDTQLLTTNAAATNTSTALRAFVTALRKNHVLR